MSRDLRNMQLLGLQHIAKLGRASPSSGKSPSLFGKEDIGVGIVAEDPDLHVISSYHAPAERHRRLKITSSPLVGED